MWWHDLLAWPSGLSLAPFRCFIGASHPCMATGDQIGRLLGWLEAAGAPILCEVPLLRALRSMPLPWSSGSQPRALAGPELEPLRSDGYRTLVSVHS